MFGSLRRRASGVISIGESDSESDGILIGHLILKALPPKRFC